MGEIPEPGRERDVCIAERVFSRPTRLEPCEWSAWLVFTDTATPMALESVPHYSTDDAAALAVLTAMEARGWQWRISWHEQGYDGSYFVMFDRYLPARRRYHTWGETLAAAITEAALRALEAAEDAADLAEAKEVLAEGGEPVPWEQLKRECGLEE